MVQLAFFLYRSETAMLPGSSAAHDLLVTARCVNAERHLTGFLHHEDGFFFQWLEGAPAQLDLIAGRIERDHRHHSLSYLSRGPIAARQFSGWQMGYSTQLDDSILKWLAERDAPQRDKRGYADAVLSFLRARNAATR